MTYIPNASTTFTWTINALKVQPSLDALSNVVTHVDYTLSATRDGFSYAMPVPQDLGLPDANSFTDVTGLTDNAVIGWMIDLRGADQIGGLQMMADRSIDAQIAANSVVTMAWPVSNAAA